MEGLRIFVVDENYMLQNFLYSFTNAGSCSTPPNVKIEKGRPVSSNTKADTIII